MTRFSQPSFLRGAPRPLVLSVNGRGESPFDLYQKVAVPAQPSFLLESGKGEGSGQHSFLGSGPASLLPHASSTTPSSDDPFSPLRQSIAPDGIERTPDLPPFFGGAIGCFSYDFVRRLERLPAMAIDDLSLPDMHFALYDLVTAIDHHANRIQMIFCPSLDRFLGEARDKLYREGLDRLAELEARFTSSPKARGDSLSLTAVSFRPEQTKQDYLGRVLRCQDYIAAGDIYQANLSHRFAVEIPQDYRSGHDRLLYEQALYSRLRSVNPSPFSGLLRFGDMSLVSCSPERLVRLRGRRADTRPIAGTRPRGSNADDDRRLVRELLADQKERAEHIMLVDLERNDLGRVCEFGTVQVDEFMAVEQYSHVSHLVSNVQGTLRPHAAPFDLISAVFPGGTVTGVPKIRCMEIIDELEPVRRGPYTGSFGYIGWNGDMDLNIVIRTLFMTGERGYLQVGAGIVADSDPAREYQETLHKAQAFFSSVRQA